MEKPNQGQCEGFCSMCDIDCHFRYAARNYNRAKKNAAHEAEKARRQKDNFIERIIREEGESDPA